MDISSIYSFGIEELWELFRSEITEDLKNKNNLKILEAVKKGDKIKVDIRIIIAGLYKEHHKYETVEVGRKEHNLYEFLDEIDKRKDLMRKWLKVNWDTTGLGSAREEDIKQGEEVLKTIG